MAPREIYIGVTERGSGGRRFGGIGKAVVGKHPILRK